jgi:hypothetical protein
MSAAWRARVWSVVATLGVGVALASCGGTANAQSVVLKSTDATVAAKTAKVYEKVTVEGASASFALPDMTATGAVDLVGRKATMAMKVGGQDADLVMIGSVVYERIPALRAATGKQWLKIDLDTIGQAAGVEGLGSLAQSTSNDPGAALAYLRGAGSVEDAGHESVRGETTTHYKAVVDLEQAAGRAPEAQARTLRQVAKLLGVAKQPIDVWIDGDGRVRRLTETIDYTKANLPASVPKTALPKRMTILVEYFDFGTPVSVEAPPASDVGDFSELLGQGGGGPAS